MASDTRHNTRRMRLGTINITWERETAFVIYLAEYDNVWMILILM